MRACVDVRVGVLRALSRGLLLSASEARAALPVTPPADSARRRLRPQAQTLKPYLTAIRSSLTAAICLRNFASQSVERHNKPEVEARADKELLLQPLVISRNEKERCMIETSINAVRVSIKIKQADEVEEVLVDRFGRFLQQRAEEFFILRRKPVEGYDITFLITNFHTEEMWKHKLVDFVVQFMEEIDSEISALKLAVNSRARLVASNFLKQFV